MPLPLLSRRIVLFSMQIVLILTVLHSIQFDFVLHIMPPKSVPPKRKRSSDARPQLCCPSWMKMWQSLRKDAVSLNQKFAAWVTHIKCAERTQPSLPSMLDN